MVADSNAKSEKIWYYEKEGTRVGPYSEEDIKEGIQLGQINRSTLLWGKGLQQWEKIEDTQFKEQLNSEIPPLGTTNIINNIYIVLLSVSPILGIFIEAIFILFTKHPSVQLGTASEWQMYFSSITFIISLIFFAQNIFYSKMDMKVLEKAGYKINKIIILWVLIFIPAYLWQRARYTKQTQIYLVIWIINFAVLIFWGNIILTTILLKFSA